VLAHGLSRVLVHLRIFDRKTLAVGQTTNRPQRANALTQGVSRYPPTRLKRVCDRQGSRYPQMHQNPPDTLLRWHRQLIAMKWTFARKGSGRPRLRRAIEELIVRMASENPGWGSPQSRCCELFEQNATSQAIHIREPCFLVLQPRTLGLLPTSYR
jgi:hypothetical protein